MEGMKECPTTVPQPQSPHSQSGTADNLEVQQKDYEDMLNELEYGDNGLTVPLPSSPVLAPMDSHESSRPLANCRARPSPAADVYSSKIIDNNNRVNVQRMLDLRQDHQSGTSTRSERTIKLDPKFTINRLNNLESKLSVREASHHVRVMEDLAAPSTKRSKTAREQRWQEATRQVQEIVSEEGERMFLLPEPIRQCRLDPPSGLSY
ncbi:hypothetical protein C8Q73DRAFT_789805 [Cubamyces lactineus]|nr:hypothetical protein C8Q73DRAFT_789805 [Cubamyces lactineus]